MSNRKRKKLLAEQHNKAYLESKKPKQPRPSSRNTALQAHTILAIATGSIPLAEL